MGTLFGIVAGAASSWLTFQLAVQAFGNAGGKGLALSLVVLAGGLGFLSGSSAFRRAKRTHDRLTLFSSLAFALSFALVGALFMIALTAAYTGSYSAPDAGDTVLTTLAFPILAALGACVGGLSGWLLGLISAGALRILAPASR